MPETIERKELEDLQQDLQDVQERLRRHRIVESLVERQQMPKHELVESLVHKQHLAELRAKLDQMHAADIAYILEALPINERLVVWDLVKAERDGEILLELSEPVRESLIRTMDSDELVAAVETLDTDEIAELAPDLPDEVIQDVFQSLPVAEREQLRAAMSYPEDAVGALMDFDVVSIRDDVTLETVTRYLRRFDELPDHTDQLFVADREQRLKGVLPIAKLVVTDLDTAGGGGDAEGLRHALSGRQGAGRGAGVRALRPRVGGGDRPGGQARGPGDRRCGGRFHPRRRARARRSPQGGLRETEDVFAPVWESVKNRWAWLAINLVTAFIASRVIGAFEGSIEKLVALAALMPIVAGIGGNSGNQTITMIVRALALGQIQLEQAKKLFAKEIGVALANGGGLGRHPRRDRLGALRQREARTGDDARDDAQPAARRDHGGRDSRPPWRSSGAIPALGSSVLITACTDSGGFFIFLGLATLFLL